MHNIVDNLISIKKEIQSNNSKAEIVAVSKTFPLSKILPLINFGHIHYGENKIQSLPGGFLPMFSSSRAESRTEVRGIFPAKMFLQIH